MKELKTWLGHRFVIFQKEYNEFLTIKTYFWNKIFVKTLKRYDSWKNISVKFLIHVIFTFSRQKNIKIERVKYGFRIIKTVKIFARL